MYRYIYAYYPCKHYTQNQNKKNLNKSLNPNKSALTKKKQQPRTTKPKTNQSKPNAKRQIKILMTFLNEN